MRYEVNVDDNTIKKIIGVNDINLKLLEELYDCDIVYRDNYFNLLTDDENKFLKFGKHIDNIIDYSKQNDIDYNYIKQSFMNAENNDYYNKIIGYSFSGKPYKAKTIKQYKFVEMINNNDLVFSIGPAGTGKTFLSVLMAVNYYKKNLVKKIIITRPAVEAGESLGFLPGDLKEKIDPYLMPIYDALDNIISSEQKDKLIEKGVIEIMPLAYMRGRTLNDSFVILDEAQNTTSGQMLMFLTRLGFNSKMIVNGDITQIDLNINKNKSGLVVAANKLKGINNISFLYFDNSDVVRNPLVQVIIEKFSDK